MFILNTLIAKVSSALNKLLGKSIVDLFILLTHFIKTYLNHAICLHV